MITTIFLIALYSQAHNNHMLFNIQMFPYLNIQKFGHTLVLNKDSLNINILFHN